MTAGDRFRTWIDDTAKIFSTRLGSFLGNTLAAGTDAFFKLLGKSFAPKLTPFFSLLQATGKIPPELQPLLDEMIHPTGEASAMISSSAANGLVGGAVGKILDGILLPIAYGVNQLTHNVYVNEGQALSAWVRGDITEDSLDFHLNCLGIDVPEKAILKNLTKALYGAEQLIGLWKRDNSREAELKAQVHKLGISDPQWEDLKKLSMVLPTASDIVRFAVREVYTPEVAEKYGQFQDFPELAMPDANTIGFSRELLKKYWASHWELPSASAGYEMLHRGIITHNDLETLLKTLDVMPFWRDKLIQTAYTPYTRVDARRMWDMGTLNDTALKKSYTDIGYDNEHANTMVIWTKVYQTYPDLIARYKNGYINLDDVRSELIQLGVSTQQANYLIEQKIKKVAPERVAKERDLTKAEIIKGLYKGVIDEATATELLKDMGYDEAEAKFIIIINMPKEDTKAEQSTKQLTKTDVINGLKKEILTEADAIAKLVAIRYTPEDANYLVRIALATKATVTETKERELTKAEIVKGVKVGLITAEEGYLMLQDIGYSPDNAAFILLISSAITTGSPDSYSDFKSLTQAYRKAEGLVTKPVTTDLQRAERVLITAKAALDYGKQHKVTDSELIKLEKAVSETTYAYKQALAKYKEST